MKLPWNPSTSWLERALTGACPNRRCRYFRGHTGFCSDRWLEQAFADPSKVTGPIIYRWSAEGER